MFILNKVCIVITRKTVLEQPEPHRSGVLGVKIAILMVEDGVEIDCKWHRTSIPIDVDPQAQMDAVNAHLESMGLPALPQSDIDFIVQCHALMVERGAQQ
jgi:hypothetical protein